MFIVTLRGEHVFHECVLVGAISDTCEKTFDKVRKAIKKDFNLEVYDFGVKFGTYNALTSNPKVKVFIERVYSL